MSLLITSGKPVTVPAAIPDGNALEITSWKQLCAWEIDGDPVPVDLVLDVRLTTSSGRGFPSVYANNFCAGAYYDTGAGPTYTWDDSADGCIAIKIECGTGNAPRTLYGDARGGRYALGPNQWVRVSVARWLAAGTTDTVVQGAIAPADGSGDYLTYSAVIDGVAALDTAALAVPPGAVWWEFYPLADTSWSAISMDTVSPWIARRYESVAAPVYNPPTTPLPLLGSNGIVLTNQGAAPAGVCLTFWVR